MCGGSGSHPGPTKEVLSLEFPFGDSAASCELHSDIVLWLRAEACPVPSGLGHFPCLHIYNL